MMNFDYEIKTFFGTEENPVDDQVNEWFDEKTRNYCMEVIKLEYAMCETGHSVCVFYKLIV